MALTRAFFTVSGMTMASRVLGLGREILIAALLGASAAAEAFFVAFRFPNLFRRFFAEGAFNMAFVPLFAKKLEGEGPDAARDFAEAALAGLLSILFLLTLIAQLTMPWLILGIAYGFADDPDKLSLAVALGRIQFPYLLFMSLTALISGVLNSLGKFAAAAGAPVLLNLLMIAALLGAWSMGSDQAETAHLLAWSVFAAGIAQFALVSAALRRAGLSLRIRRPRWTPDMKRLVILGVPGALAGGVTQINILIGTVIASFYDGAIVWLTLADRVYQLPLGVIGVAIGVALLPALARKLRAGDGAAANGLFNRAIEVSLFFTLPATIALLCISEEVVRLLFGHGAFTESDVRKTGEALALYAAGLPAYVLIKALSPAYFSREDTKTPLIYAAASMALNTALSVGLAPQFGFLAIPIGTAAAAWLNVALLWLGVARRGMHSLEPELLRRVGRTLLASLLMGAALVAATLEGRALLLDPALRYPATLALVALGAAVFAAFAVAFRAASLSELRAQLRAPR